jgi:hypothetical protein
MAPLVVVVGLAMLAGGGAASAEERYAVERFRVADRKKDQIQPRVADDWIVWKDYRGLSLREVDDSPNGEIYAWNLATNEEYQVSKSKASGDLRRDGRLDRGEPEDDRDPRLRPGGSEQVQGHRIARAAGVSVHLRRAGRLAGQSQRQLGRLRA